MCRNKYHTRFGTGPLFRTRRTLILHANTLIGLIKCKTHIYSHLIELWLPMKLLIKLQPHILKVSFMILGLNQSRLSLYSHNWSQNYAICTKSSRNSNNHPKHLKQIVQFQLQFIQSQVFEWGDECDWFKPEVIFLSWVVVVAWILNIQRNGYLEVVVHLGVNPQKIYDW